MKKVFGWVLLLLGVYLAVNNLIAVFFGSLTNIVGVLLGVILVWVGWRLSHPKSIARREKEQDEKEKGTL